VRRTGWLLDGFPRTAEQAAALQAAGCSPDSLVLIDQPAELIIEQATLRRFDPETGAIYHLKDSPPVGIVRQAAQAKQNIARVHA
jgi:adenylate kinase